MATKEHLSKMSNRDLEYIQKVVPKRKEIFGREQVLREKMDEIALFPGSLQEYVQLMGKEYQLVDIPGNRKFLEGGLARWEIDTVEPSERPTTRQDFLNPLAWRHLKFLNIRHRLDPDPYHDGKIYSQVLRQAAELGADALIYYNNNDYPYISSRETGVPIKRVAPIQAPR